MPREQSTEDMSIQKRSPHCPSTVVEELKRGLTSSTADESGGRKQWLDAL